jgi:hypothetical protein
VGKRRDGHAIHIVARRPTSPNAGDGRRGIDEDAIHVNQQPTANDSGHKKKIVA